MSMISCSPSRGVSWIRWISSLANRNTYTPCATISPRYSGNCSQREEKISAGSGLRRAVRSFDMSGGCTGKAAERTGGRLPCQGARASGGRMRRHQLAQFRFQFGDAFADARGLRVFQVAQTVQQRAELVKPRLLFGDDMAAAEQAHVLHVVRVLGQGLPRAFLQQPAQA